MRKLVAFCHLSLDGIAATPDGGLGWVSYDQELEKWAEGIVKATDTCVYGRVTYELMKYWKTVPAKTDATEHEREHARWIENVEKIVVSTTMQDPDWNNTRVVQENVKETILELKQRSGENITIFGSPTLTSTLVKLGLVDEYQLSVSPIVLGTGKTLFKEISEATKLKLIEEKTLHSGVVTLHYATI
jgi:dihydrofolate reductase